MGDPSKARIGCSELHTVEITPAKRDQERRPGQRTGRRRVYSPLGEEPTQHPPGGAAGLCLSQHEVPKHNTDWIPISRGLENTAVSG